MGKADNPRLQAARIISGVLDNELNIEEAADNKPSGTDPRDAAFSRYLVYGVLRWLNALEWIAGNLLRKPLKDKDRDIQRLILIGLFQLWKEESAEHAAVHETAECARLVRKPWAVGLINAVLRRFQREQDQILTRLAAQPDRFAHPQWLLDAIRRDWPSSWQAIAEANNRQAGLWLRVNRARSEVDSVSDLLKEAGFETRTHEFAPHALEVTPATAVERLPGFGEGLWSVQDPAAQLAVEWLDIQPGHRILDACSAPGGKTCHIREAVPGAHVTALDRSATRLKRLTDNAERLGLIDSEYLQTLAADALDPEEWWDGETYDRILLDAPCTATGVIRRHPEIKWLRSPQQVQESTEIQAALLKSLWPLLKPGGILVYATCSVLNDENSNQIRQFIKDRGDAEVAPPEVAYGHRSSEGCQILPGETDMDGFFYSRIRKSS